jgi:hypothetical protein
MIQNDEELKLTRERIAYFLDLLARLRVSSRPEELALVSGGYRAAVEPHATRGPRLPHPTRDRDGWLTDAPPSRP